MSRLLSTHYSVMKSILGVLLWICLVQAAWEPPVEDSTWQPLVDFLKQFFDYEHTSCEPIIFHSDGGHLWEKLVDSIISENVIKTFAATEMQTFTESLNKISYCIVLVDIEPDVVNQMFETINYKFYEWILVIKKHFDALPTEYSSLYNVDNSLYIEYDNAEITILRHGFLALDKGNMHNATWKGSFKKEMHDILFPKVTSPVSIITVTSAPFVVIENDEGVYRFTGFETKMFKEIAGSYGWKYVQKERAIKSWGTIVNGSWIGMVGDVIYGKADTAMSEISITFERYQDADYTFPYIFDGLTYLTNRPKLKTKWQTIITSFSPLVWGLVALSLLVCTITMTGVSHAVSLTGIEPMTDSEARWCTKITSVFFFCFSLLTLHVPFKSPSANVIRVIIGWALLFSEIISFCYTSQLIAQFSSTEYNKIPTTFEGLVEANYTIIKFNYNGFWEETLRRGSTESIRQVYRALKFVPVEPFITSENLFENYTGNWAYLSGKWNLRMGQTLLNEHGFRLGKEILVPGGLAWPIRKFSPLKEPLNKGILSLQQAGLISKWFDEELEIYVKERTGKTKFERRKEIEEDLKILSLTDLQSPFILLAFGVGIAVTLLAIEVILFLALKQKE